MMKADYIPLQEVMDEWKVTISDIKQHCLEGRLTLSAETLDCLYCCKNLEDLRKRQVSIALTDDILQKYGVQVDILAKKNMSNFLAMQVGMSNSIPDRGRYAQISFQNSYEENKKHYIDLLSWEESDHFCKVLGLPVTAHVKSIFSEQGMVFCLGKAKGEYDYLTPASSQYKRLTLKNIFIKQDEKVRFENCFLSKDENTLGSIYHATNSTIQRAKNALILILRTIEEIDKSTCSTTPNSDRQFKLNLPGKVFFNFCQELDKKALGSCKIFPVSFEQFRDEYCGGSKSDRKIVKMRSSAANLSRNDEKAWKKIIADKKWKNIAR